MATVVSTFNVVARGVGRTDYSITVSQLNPIERANKHNLAVSANTDILDPALTSIKPPSLFRTMIAVSVAGIFKATIRKEANTQTLAFNAGTNLKVDSLYVFDVLVHEGDIVNFQHSVNTTIQVLRIQEIFAGVQ